MKKTLLVFLSILVLCGCSSNHNSNVSDGDTVLFETPDGVTYTKSEAYDAAKGYDISDTLTNGLTLKICELEEIDLSNLEEEAKQEIQDAQDNGYYYYIEYYYGGDETFIENYIVSTALNKLKANYINLDLDKYITEYEPFKAEVVSFDNEESAKNVVNSTKDSDSTFAYACTSNGYEGEVVSAVYVKDNSGLPTEVEEYVSTAKVGVSDVIKCDEVSTDSDGNSTTNSTYYVVNLLSKDANEFLDDFATSISGNIDTTEVINYYLSVYPIEIHDQDVYDILSPTYEAIK